jgi:hypothetical protein
MKNRQVANLYTYTLRCIRVLLARTGGLRERNPKPTGQIHHALWIVLLPQLFQFLEITTVKILHARRVRERRADEVREPLRRLTLRVDLVSEFRQRRLHGVDPVLVVLLVLPGEVDDDRAVGLAFYVRPSRVCRLVEHGLGKGPQANAGTRAPMFFHIFGRFLERSAGVVSTDRGFGCGSHLPAIVFRFLR